MREEGIWSEVAAFLRYQLFEVGETTVTPSKILIFLGIVAIAYLFSAIVQRGLMGALHKRRPESAARISGLVRLLHYFLVMIGFAIGLQSIGVDLSILFAAGAVFAVGVGFAVQNVAQNFVSGLLLLVERAIKPGDILEVEDRMVKVQQVGIRATIARTRDDEDVIIPNSVLVQSTVTNYTLRDSMFRVRADVGVAYESDLETVKKALQEAAEETSQVSESPRSRILLRGYGDSTVNYELSIWIDDPWKSQVVESDLLEAIWRAFKRHEVVIAFPQIDIHLDAPVERAFSTLPKLIKAG